MESAPKILGGISAYAWTRAIYGAFGVALSMISIGAASIGVHAFSSSSSSTTAGAVALSVGRVCAWGIFFVLLAELPLIIAMNVRVRRERKRGYATVRTKVTFRFSNGTSFTL